VVYLGGERDHVIVGGVFCSCEGFARRAPRGLGGCTHVFAYREAARSGRLARAELSPGEVVRVVWEVLTGGLTKTLRQKLYYPR